MAVTRMLLVALALSASTAAHAERLSQLRGRALDHQTKAPVEGALVHVSGPQTQRTLSTDRNGRYAIILAPGTYDVTFSFGRSRTTRRVVVSGTVPTELDGRIDARSGEVIVIRDPMKPAVPPRVTNFNPRRAPPYSDRAVLEDAWTKAWMLLDVGPDGTVRRYKWLKKPGYDLEQIAHREVLALKFEPARNAQGEAIATHVVWSIEWPSAWWLQQITGTRSRMPRATGFPPRSQVAYVPCRGSGPWLMGSVHKTYRDCSKPDLAKARTERWVARSTKCEHAAPIPRDLGRGSPARAPRSM